MSSRISTAGGFDAAVPRILFSASRAGVTIQSWSFCGYTVSPDGTQIVASRDLAGETRPNLVVVENWHEEFSERDN